MSLGSDFDPDNRFLPVFCGVHSEVDPENHFDREIQEF